MVLEDSDELDKFLSAGDVEDGEVLSGSLVVVLDLLLGFGDNELEEFALEVLGLLGLVVEDGALEVSEVLGVVGVLESLDLSADQSGLSLLVLLDGVLGESVLVVEGDFLDEGGLVVLRVSGIAFLEVIPVEVVVSSGEDFGLIESFLDEFVFWVVFDIRLEVVSVLLFLFGHFSEEDGVVVFPPLLLEFIHSLFSSLVVFSVEVFSGLELLDLSESSVQFSDGLFDIDQNGVVNLVDWEFSHGSVSFDEFSLDVPQGEVVGLGDSFDGLGSLHSEGGIDQDSVVFIGVDQRVDHIGWGFELGVVVVRSVLHGTHHGPHISLSHFDRVVGVEAGHVVVHFWAVLVSESDEFENLTTLGTSLEWTLSEHEEQQFVTFIIIFIHLSSATNISEWDLRRENN